MTNAAQVRTINDLLPKPFSDVECEWVDFGSYPPHLAYPRRRARLLWSPMPPVRWIGGVLTTVWFFTNAVSLPCSICNQRVNRLRRVSKPPVKGARFICPFCRSIIAAERGAANVEDVGELPIPVRYAPKHGEVSRD